MLLAPYNIPASLANRPFAAVFWTILAPTVILYAISFVLNIVTGGWIERILGEGGSLEAQWMLFALAHFTVFAAMSFWSESIGAGPFAGPMRTEGDWVAIAVITGPILHVMTVSMVTLVFSGGDPEWMYREGFDARLFSSAAITPVMVAFVILLAPLVEEVAFRGIALGCLIARGWSPVAAALVTSAVFAGLHVNYVLPALIPVFITGLYLALLRVASGSMAAPILAHISTNAVMLAFAAGPTQG